MIGSLSSPARNQIDYITITTGGNSVSFGDLTYSTHSISSTASKIRGIFAGGATTTNDINYVIINTQGDAVDFGDLSVGRQRLNAASNGHGGL